MTNKSCFGQSQSTKKLNKANPNLKKIQTLHWNLRQASFRHWWTQRSSFLCSCRLERGEFHRKIYPQYGAVIASVAIVNHHTVVATGRVKFQFEVYECKLDNVFFFDDVLWDLNSPAACYLIRIVFGVLWRMKWSDFRQQLWNSIITIMVCRKGRKRINMLMKCQPIPAKKHSILGTVVPCTIFYQLTEN